jgi:protoporphyrinogen oxidase
MSLKRAVFNALFGGQDAKSLIKEFDYPRLGPGMMWERCQQLVEEQGSPVYLNTNVIKVEREGNRVTAIVTEQDGKITRLTGDHFINSMPVSALLHRLDPLPPDEVLQAARGLKYRDFLIVSLIVKRKDLFPDNWLYIHSPEFQVGRIQNFKNWSPEMVPDADKSCLGMEYFCSEGDALWEMDDQALIQLATAEVIRLNLGVAPGDVEDGVVIRQHKAYPVYDGEYRQHLQVLQDYLQSFENLQTVGRNGMHRYNNQDHSMLSAMLAVRNILGESHDLWNINTERSYQEDFTTEEWNQRQKKSVLQDITPGLNALDSTPSVASV